MTPTYWPEAVAHLKQDAVLAKIIADYGESAQLENKKDPFATLVRAILGQQISVAAAASVQARFSALVGEPWQAEKILAHSDEELRACGLSRQKIAYIRGLAEAELAAHFHPKHFAEDVPDEAVAKHLIQLKGVGVWTAEMFLMFHLLRPNILPVGDLGLRKAINLHYNGGEKLDEAATLKLAQPWAPYRTVATWYLWRSLDPVPVAY